MWIRTLRQQIRSMKKPHPRPKDEPTLKRWVLAAGFLAFVSTDTNLHFTRYLELPHADTSVHRSIRRKQDLFPSIRQVPHMKSLDKERLSCQEAAEKGSEHAPAQPRRKQTRAFLSPHDAAGKRRMNVVPLPTSLSTSIVPLWYSTACFTMARPRPVPPVSFERLFSMR